MKYPTILQIVLLLTLSLIQVTSGAYTEFYVQTTGDNLNAGSTTSDTAAQTYAGGTFVRSTGIFVVVAGDPVADGVAVGDFASIYTTAGATVATFVARVTARDTTTITVSLTAIAGAATTVSETAAAATCKVGGAWDGPAGAVSFPFGFATSTMTNSSSDEPRVNFLSGVTYSVTAAMTHSNTHCNFEGYASSPGDGGKATISGGDSGASYVVLTITSGRIKHFIFDDNGSTGSATGVSFTGTGVVESCVFANMRGTGCAIGISQSYLVLECEAYGNGVGVSSSAGFTLSSATTTFIRCISHNNSYDGFALQSSQPGRFIQCIADSNGDEGFDVNAVNFEFLSCDSYANTSNGFEFVGSSSGHMIMENCNAVDNGGWGINWTNTGSSVSGYLYNTGYGSGTAANGSGTFNGTLKSAVIRTGDVTYDANVTPWVDPANGDFRINLTAAQGTGRGTFLQTAPSYSGTIGYPDIGSAQSQDISSGGETSATSTE